MGAYFEHGDQIRGRVWIGTHDSVHMKTEAIVNRYETISEYDSPSLKGGGAEDLCLNLIVQCRTRTDEEESNDDVKTYLDHYQHCHSTRCSCEHTTAMAIK